MATHVVALSGGKDSTAMALRLAEVEPREYLYVCTPTGDEMPDVFAHWDHLECVLKAPIIKLEYPGGLKQCLADNNMIPNFRARFCTRQLKIEVMQTWLNQQLDPVLYVGLRADEDGREGGIYDNAVVDFPFRRWSWGIEEVVTYLDQRDIKIPMRTDCARCFFQRLGDWYRLWQEYPDVYEDAVQDEVTYGHTYRSEGRDTWPAALSDLRNEFERGRIPNGVEMTPDLFGFEANQCRVCTL